MNVLKWIFIILGSLIGVIALYLSVVIFFPFSEPKPPIEVTETEADEKQQTPANRQDISFPVNGTSIHAWLYLPENLAEPVPCIIMSHGFGGTKDIALESYALRYTAAGYAVLTYDFRYFGQSEGEPRQLYYAPYQLEDLKAAIEYARDRSEINPEKIVLWGTSAGGGYGIVIAAEDKKIAGIIGQCPALDEHADGDIALKREGIGFILKLIVHAQRDKGRSRFGLSPHRVPIVGKPGTTAILTAPGAFDGYASLVSGSPYFRNEICTRFMLMPHGPNPIDCAGDVECPVLLLICENDNLVSEASYKNTARILGDYAEVRTYPIGHFDIYKGEHFERAVSDSIAFLQKHLND